MATIGIYDYDFITYPPLIPNLECAKLSQYYKRKRDIAIIAPQFIPGKYTKVFFRKDYDDGIYPEELTAPNVEYGGRAFSPDEYIPLPEDIEKQKPDLSGYYRYHNIFNTPLGRRVFTKLQCAQHLRLSLDGRTVWKDFEQQLSINRRTNVLILHDYDLVKIQDCTSVIKELSKRYTYAGDENPRRVGFKFPVKIYTSEQLSGWGELYPTLDIYSLEYCGIVNDEQLYELAEHNKSMIQNFVYNITYEWNGQDDFMKHQLPKIYMQILFLKSRGINFSLKYDDKIKMGQNLKNFLRLLKFFAKSRENLSNSAVPSCTLYKYVSSAAYKELGEKYGTVVPLQDVRESFQYIRNKNYSLFKLLYECAQPILKGGVFCEQ